MKLILNTGAVGDQGTVNLPDGLLWEDEFKWTPAVQAHTYTLTGALIVEVGTRQAGMPITLSATDDMAWVTRTTMENLKAWASLQDRIFTLTFEYPTDIRSFTVMFDQSGEGAVEGKPVAGHPSHAQGDWFSVMLRFIEI